MFAAHSNAVNSASRAKESVEERLFGLIFETFPPTFNIRTSDGHVIERTPSPKFTIVLKDSKLLKDLLYYRDDSSVDKAYLDKRFDIEGDIFEGMKFLDSLPHMHVPPKRFWAIMKNWFLL